MSNTRNSAVADKPRDAFVQMQFGADDLPPKHVPLHMCYHAEFGRSTSKDVDISRRIPKHGERGAPPLGMGRGWSLQQLPCPMWSLLVKQYQRTWRSPENRVPCVPPFKVTDGHRNWYGSIGYQWLLINVPLQPRACLYRFQDITIYSKKCDFCHPTPI